MSRPLFSYRYYPETHAYLGEECCPINYSKSRIQVDYMADVSSPGALVAPSLQTNIVTSSDTVFDRVSSSIMTQVPKVGTRTEVARVLGRQSRVSFDSAKV